VAFTRTRDGTANVWTVNVTTRAFVQVTSTTSKLGYVTPAWQPT
jgi:Tol biopolymer transport system component